MDGLKVWVVEPIGYNQYGILGVFATLEAAKERYAYAGPWRGSGDEWESADADACSETGYSIYACKVQS